MEKRGEPLKLRGNQGLCGNLKRLSRYFRTGVLRIQAIRMWKLKMQGRKGSRQNKETSKSLILNIGNLFVRTPQKRGSDANPPISWGIRKRHNKKKALLDGKEETSKPLRAHK